MNQIELIDRTIHLIDSKICGIIDDYKVLNDSQKVADYTIQFLRTFLETISARIYAGEHPNELVPIRGKDKWFSNYMKSLKQDNEYGYIWRMHSSLQITTSHYVPAEDGSVRLMTSYLPLLYQLRSQLKEKYDLCILHNLEDYPQEREAEFDSFYESLFWVVKDVDAKQCDESTNDRYYIMRKKYRVIGEKGFFEYTLSYAQEEITKFDKFVVYTVMDIPDNYSIQCDFARRKVIHNGIEIDIKIITSWKTSIRPCELEKLARICGKQIKVRSDQKYYRIMMSYFSKTGMNLLDLVSADTQEEYNSYIKKFKIDLNNELKNSLDLIRRIVIYDKPGSNILRYLLVYLKNDVILDQIAEYPNSKLSNLYLKYESIPFDEMPYATSLYHHNISNSRLYRCLQLDDYEYQYVASLVNEEAYNSNTLYYKVEEEKMDYFKLQVEIFNNRLYDGERQQLRRISSFGNHFYVENYYNLTKTIIEELQDLSSSCVEEYREMLLSNDSFLQTIDDDIKQEIVRNIFLDTRLGIIYGPAGTGKTKVAEYVAHIFCDKHILLLANTNAAKNNLEQRIDELADCYTIYDYLKNGDENKVYDLVIVDECSTVCNEDMLKVLRKCKNGAFLLLGDIYQIESIEFGNWFNFARYFVGKKSVHELSTPYRAKDNQTLLTIWGYVREYDENMFDRLQANGYISALNESIFQENEEEIILCLGYDGLYGINNINRYMQKINPSEPITWGNWTYKVGDKILFNENRRFGKVLHNNLKGVIVSIEKNDDEIIFQILVDKIINRIDALFAGIAILEVYNEKNKTLIEINVKKRVERDADADYSEEVVPFQIAYAVSIHKAQGLEYKSVKIVITEDVDERITHNIFYTAITRTTERLMIYMSKETQAKLAERFVKNNVILQQAQLFAGHSQLRLINT